MRRISNPIGRNLRVATIALAIALATIVNQSAQAQTYTVIHTFTGGADGAVPYAGLTIDKAGNLYGTTSEGGTRPGYGAVYKLANKNGSWVVSPLYDFAGGAEGAGPTARVVLGPDGSLYGTTAFEGCGNNGTVFNLKPPASACKSALCPWTEAVLYCFQQEGAQPGWGDLAFDRAGNVYGTTLAGGDSGLGTVFMLTSSGGSWTENVLHSFGAGDGAMPYDGVVFDSVGNLYGTTAGGGQYGLGTVFQLTHSGRSWVENVIHSFQGSDDGANPYGGLIFDQSGNLYGTTTVQGSSFGGTVFQLVATGGTWTLNSIDDLSDGSRPWASLTMDAAGNLYGTTNGGGDYNRGSVFKLTPANGVWTQTVLYSFTDKDDGGYPSSTVTIDANGTLYGTTRFGGTGSCGGGCGVVWEITP